ncbi:pyrroline-5-carboxylate reductase [Victivallis sp. Marseille-Q1083]|uniref:pyrroline-5-carboxylate reductase n=1 Tax=Victivallis sp. Marseille-Q1083 TaxID=2717288 RepID=UPI00158DBCED|nr:pyrroline-5-carboxylate reductase [Victivallis sp. Marseille-Q1083]
MLNRILFIGAGRMATAIAGGMAAGDFNLDTVTAFDISEAAAERFAAATGIRALGKDGLDGLIKASGTVILAVKPQYLKTALEGKKALLADKLILSIVAGVKLARLEELTGSSRIARVMPNTPALVGAGASAYAMPGIREPEERQLVRRILEAVGVAVEIPEALFDAVTALSGSGPAYVLEMIQALADGGVLLGLPRELALALAAQTVAGTARLVQKTGEHPSVLRDQVTSPGGTTAQALLALETGAFKGTLLKAMTAAAERSAELGKSK